KDSKLTDQPFYFRTFSISRFISINKEELAMPKIAFISGANKGIGLETARQLGQQGITVLLGTRNLAKGLAAAATLRQEGLDPHAIQFDVLNPADIQAAVAKIEADFGALDILIN